MPVNFVRSIGLFCSVFLALVCNFAIGESQFSEKEIRLIEGKQVHFSLLGVAKREFLFFDIYDVANYVEGAVNRTDKPSIQGGDVNHQYLDETIEGFIGASQAKMLILKYFRAIEAKKVREVLQESIQKNVTGAEWLAIREELAHFLTTVSREIKKGDVLELIWLPGDTPRLMSRFDGQVFMREQSPLFLRSLWSIWIGRHAVVDREALF